MSCKIPPHSATQKDITRALKHQQKVINLAPPLILSLCIILLILMGSLLLKLPISTTQSITWMESLFTSTSAVTVTGLGVVDTETRFTHFGQIVIALLIQLGGIGLMTFAVITIIALGGKLSFLNQTIAKEAFNQTNTLSIYSTAKVVIIFSLIAESIGFIILTIYWLPSHGFGKSAFDAFFYVISAFNNAGFALSSDNMMQYVDDITVNITITMLIITGGLGFSVWADIAKHKKWHKLSLYSRLMIKSTLYLNLIAFIVILLLEFNNPDTLGKLSSGGKFLAAWFGAITPRTAGFNTIDYASINDSTASVTLLLMFIGGGSLSTASGIKVVTFVLLILATFHYINRKERLTIDHREIAQYTIHKAFSVAILALAFCWLGVFILTITEKAPFLDIIFEVVSALSTVGLSRGLTTHLTLAGQIIIISLMIIGRLGPITFIYFFARPQQSKIRYAQTKLPIG